jgi:hypothetical protein
MLYLCRRARMGGGAALAVLAFAAVALVAPDRASPGLGATELPHVSVVQQLEQAVAGEPLIVSIKVTHYYGDAEATDVVVTHTLATELDSSSAVLGGPGAPACSFVGQDITCDAGTLGPGDRFEFTVTTDGLPAGETATNCSGYTMVEESPWYVEDTHCLTVIFSHAGPDIVASGPGVIPAQDHTFEVVFETEGPVEQAYSGYQISFNTSGNIFISIEDLSVESGLWDDVTCSQTSTNTGHPAFPVSGVHVRTFECVSTGSTMDTGVLAQATFGHAPYPVLGEYRVTMLGAHVPDGFAASGKGSATIDAGDGSLHSNALQCMGLCGLHEPHPLARDASVLVELVAPEIKLSRQASPGPFVRGQELTVDYAAENASPLVTATDFILTVNISQFVPESTTLYGPDADRCVLDGALITCDIGDMAPSDRIEFSIDTALPSPWPPWDAHGWVHNHVAATFNEWFVYPLDWAVVYMQLDSDGDGYSDVVEQALGTDYQTYCPIMRADVSHTGSVTLGDVLTLVSLYGGTVPPVPGRYDHGPFEPDGIINLNDILKVIMVFGKHVTECD